MTYCNYTSAGLRMPLGCCHLNNEIHVRLLEMHICMLHTDRSCWGQRALGNSETGKMYRRMHLCMQHASSGGPLEKLGAGFLGCSNFNMWHRARQRYFFCTPHSVQNNSGGWASRQPGVDLTNAVIPIRSSDRSSLREPLFS